ncbi:galactose oxidase [Hypoxylon sp. EC38]|nr:galactose oxidase [Hypoxylon sp. EC38]
MPFADGIMAENPRSPTATGHRSRTVRSQKIAPDGAGASEHIEALDKRRRLVVLEERLPARAVPRVAVPLERAVHARRGHLAQAQLVHVEQLRAGAQRWGLVHVQRGMVAAAHAGLAAHPRIVGDRVPSARRAHTACLYKNGIYMFGGGDGVRALNDIWRLDVTDPHKMSWKLVSGPSTTTSSSSSSSSGANGGTPVKDTSRPRARGYHTANMVGSKLIIYGGSDGGECFNDVWVYDVETHFWKAVHIPVTFRRLSHTSTIVGSYLFIVGGHDGNEYSNDVLLLNLVTMTWDKRKVYGLPPSGRGYHGTVLHDSRLVVIGGFDGSEVFSDVWILELAVHAYYSQISHFTIEV